MKMLRSVIPWGREKKQTYISMQSRDMNKEYLVFGYISENIVIIEACEAVCELHI